MKADFLVIGAMKCASSTVCAYLEDHTEVFMVPGGQPNFFSHDEVFAQGQAWYDAHYDGSEDFKLRGEGSNGYSDRVTNPQSADRIAAYNPDMKIIYMVRHPMKRIVSAWIQQRIDKGDMIPPTLDATLQQKDNSYISQSRYWHNLEAYRARFPDSQIFMGFMEDLNRDPDAFWAELCAFLGIAPRAAERGHVNPSGDKRVPGKTYTRLNQLPFSKSLKRLLPQGLKTAAKTQVLSRKASDVPKISSELEAKILALIEPDAKALLAHCGKPADFWTFDM